MTFDDFLNQAWNDHATKAEEVAQRLVDGIKLIEKEEQIPQMTHLATHIFGEHLGQWEMGLSFLEALKANPCFVNGGESDHTLVRSVAALALASGKTDSVGSLSASDHIRALAIAASALAGQMNPENAQAFFRRALDLAQTGIDRNDPANRALAVTGNNLACSLEEKTKRTEIDTKLMILAAQAGRKYWEIAGTWLEVERAEYRLAMTYLKARDLVRALEHAQSCLEIVQENNAPSLEFFFGFEVLALAEKARGNSIGYAKAVEHVKTNFAKLNADDQIWCEPSLRKLEETL